MTRLQRASKGSSQSTGRGGDNVIQGSGVRLQDRRRHLVMLRYGAMHSEYYGPLFGWKVRPAHRALNALYAHIGTVNHLRHNDRMVSRKNPWRHRATESSPTRDLCERPSRQTVIIHYR